jgi:hypothetical protein
MNQPRKSRQLAVQLAREGNHWSVILAPVGTDIQIHLEPPQAHALAEALEFQACEADRANNGGRMKLDPGAPFLC